MKTKIYAITLLLLTSCGGGKNEENKKTSYESKINGEKSLSLLVKNCFSCHNPDMECENRIAPPMFKIREHYYDDEIKKSDFINEIVSFVMNPSHDKSKMPGAVNNFGLMPKTIFKKNEVELIASYIYDNDLSSDKWFENWEKFKK